MSVVISAIGAFLLLAGAMLLLPHTPYQNRATVFIGALYALIGGWLIA